MPQARRSRQSCGLGSLTIPAPNLEMPPADCVPYPMDETRLHTALRSICRDLTEIGSPYALVGGLAVSARTEPRFTKDLDLAISAASDRNAEHIVQSLRTRLYPPYAALQPNSTWLSPVRQSA